jgi:5-methylcytosine-specific restriction endonuclease McrA
MKTKICSKCKSEKSLTEFYKDENNLYYSCCKNCKKEIGKIYWKAHKKEIQRRSNDYYKEHKKEIRKYRVTAIGIFQKIKSKAKIRDRKFSIGKENFIKWYDNQEKKCYYCNRTLLEIKHDTREKKQGKGRLSIDRKNNNKGYELDNIVLACYRCNTIKGDYFTEQEMLEIGKIIY